MKFATMWWGIQVLAETKEDETVLRDMVVRLGDTAVSSYETGTLMEMKATDADDVHGFSDIEIAAARMTIEFHR